MNKTKLSTHGFKELAILAVIGAITVIAFWPVTQADLLQFDDRVHLINNAAVRDLSAANLKRIFTTRVNDTYIPLTLLSFALEYPFFGQDPLGYHVMNLVWHLLNVLLVYYLIRRLGLRARAAGVAALIFAIHPMHVESVAWVTERKDVLYTFFYLLAMHGYLSFRRGGRPEHYVGAWLAAVLSLLAKAMAVSLPLTLLLLDYWEEGRISRRDVLNKIPFLAVAVALGLLTYLSHARGFDMNAGQAGLIWIWCFAFYLIKFAFPVVLTPLYVAPDPVSFTNASYVVPVLVLLSTGYAVVRYRRHRPLVFAVLFYVLSTFFLYRFDLTDINIVADRFMYLPSLGICLAAAWLIEKSWHRNWVRIGVPLVLLVLTVKTFQQAGLWQNDLKLFDYTIRRGVTHDIAYNSRGAAYKEAGRYDLAIKDLRRALDIQRAKGFDTSETHNNIGTVYSLTGQFQQAQYAFEHAIRENPAYRTAYFNRANIYQQLGKFEQALADYNRALALPDDSSVDISNIYYHRGMLWQRGQEWERALQDYDEAIRRNRFVAVEAYNNRGTINIIHGRHKAALADFETALTMSPEFIPARLNREQVLMDLESQRM